MKNQLNTRKFFSAMAFVALVLSGIALVISKIFFGAGSSAGAVLNNIAYILAFTVTAFYAFFYVKSRRNPVWLAIYIVVVLLVVVPLIMSMFGV